MHDIVRTFLILCVSPIIIICIHAAIQRTARWMGKKLPVQLGAFLAIFLSFFVELLVTHLFVSDDFLRNNVYQLCFIIYFLAVFLMISFLYMNLLNFSDTSLHIHILMEIARSGKLDILSLQQEYNVDTLTRIKIERLISLGLLKYEEGRLHTGNKGYLYFAYSIDLWRRVIGMPTEPKFRKDNE